MRKANIIYPFIIGEAIALIFLGVLKYSPEYLPEMPSSKRPILMGETLSVRLDLLWSDLSLEDI